MEEAIAPGAVALGHVCSFGNKEFSCFLTSARRAELYCQTTTTLRMAGYL